MQTPPRTVINLHWKMILITMIPSVAFVIIVTSVVMVARALLNALSVVRPFIHRALAEQNYFSTAKKDVCIVCRPVLQK